MTTRRALLRSALFLPLASRLLARSAAAQEQEKASLNASWLERIAQQLRDEFNLPAVWVAVDVEESIEAAVVGVRNINDSTPATLDDKLTVGSISKTMAALWIASLKDAGLVSYETKVLDVLPELAASCLPEHRNITLGQLLTHTAGVARQVRAANQIPTPLSLEQYATERLRQAKYLLATPAPPGSKGQELYSNAGVTLAVTMTERVAEESYEMAAGRFYRQRLGLKSWGVWPMNVPADLSQPWPHQTRNGVLIPQSPQTEADHFVRPSGNAHCTITDLVRFGLLSTNATKLCKSLLSSETWTAISAPVPNTSTTLTSFNRFNSNGQVGFRHNGSLGTTSSFLWVIPERATAIAVHTNARGNKDGFGKRGVNLVLNAISKRRA